MPRTLPSISRRTDREAWRALLRGMRQDGLFEPHVDRVRHAALDVGLWLVGIGLAALVHPAFAVVAAVGAIRCGYLQHDILHNQWTSDVDTSERWGRWMMPMGLGSVGWWKNTDHNPHHKAANKFPEDPNDFGGFPLHLVPALAFIPLWLLVGGFKAGDWAERLGAIGSAALLLGALGPWGGLVFCLAYFVLWVPFQVLHHTATPDVREDWVEHQIVNGQFTTGGPLLNWIMGGHNRQTEHHLFPRMPRANLPEAQRRVQRFCVSQGLAYNAVTPMEGWRSFLAVWPRAPASAAPA